MRKRFIFALILLVLLGSSAVFATDISRQSKAAMFCGGDTNVKDSLILSIVTMCLPGIIEKAHEWKQIKCESITCSYDAIKAGLDPSFCKQKRPTRPVPQ